MDGVTQREFDIPWIIVGSSCEFVNFVSVEAASVLHPVSEEVC